MAAMFILRHCYLQCPRVVEKSIVTFKIVIYNPHWLTIINIHNKYI